MNRLPSWACEIRYGMFATNKSGAVIRVEGPSSIIHWLPPPYLRSRKLRIRKHAPLGTLQAERGEKRKLKRLNQRCAFSIFRFSNTFSVITFALVFGMIPSSSRKR